MKKVKSGVCGLDALLNGGVNERSVNVVIGASGTGKTTFSVQFMKKGVEAGQIGIFITLDENKEQIINEAIEMGWHDIRQYLADKKLMFIDASGKKFADFIKTELPSFIGQWAGANTRIVIDPLTPVVWAVENRYEQRQILSFLFKETTKIGTVLTTLEEHSTAGTLSGSETVIPMYLADCVIHIRHTSDKAMPGELRVVKCRCSKHSKVPHLYTIVRGFGIVIRRSAGDKKLSREIPERIRREIDRSSLSPSVTRTVDAILADLCDDDFEGLDMAQVVQDLIDKYRD
jgi:KaiC/GvpD/RAD55 family RecA-like ATPase